MRRFLHVFLMTACATASAEAFRHIGPDGEIYFSDRPSSDSERVELRPVQTVTLPQAARRPPAEVAGVGEPADDESAFSYAQFEIVKPSFDQGVRANDGSVTIYMSLQPPLRKGHTIELIVDGEDGARIHSGEALNVNLSDMSRGRHTVEARVKDDRGENMIKTGPVGFYVLRTFASRPSPRAN